MRYEAPVVPVASLTVMSQQNTQPSASSRDRPWIIRTYAGHTSAGASNELFRANLARGQRGLSIAFDLPTQCGYSSDHPMARPEVGKVGVPINSLDDFARLFEGIPLGEMNTSMTINATSMWLFALYVALAKERGDDVRALRGTTQNDVVKEYLARGTYIFPPDASMRMVAELYEYCLDEVPRWNPSNVCSYHLQEAGATPVQELAFSVSTAVGLLDTLKSRGRLDDEKFGRAVGRISFFVNSGIRFVEELCKMRAFTELWDRLTRERYGVSDPKLRRFRYGVQVNSLGLTAAQPENNAWRIALECLGVTLSRRARCRALQLPAWNEALSLPREWDQQWMIRLQQILAYETDLLEYPDLFDGSPVIEESVAALISAAEAEMGRIQALGGIATAVDNGYLKAELVNSMAARVGAIDRGEQTIVGVNRWTEGLTSPLVEGADGGVFSVDSKSVQEALQALQRTRASRDDGAVSAALQRLEDAARSGESMVDASIECALARVTTGEWADTLRGVFGDYRAPTGIAGQTISFESAAGSALVERVASLTDSRGRRPRLLVGKPGLDGHSNGAEVIAVAARQAGFDVVYQGIRLSCEEIAVAAAEEDVDLIGLSVLSGSHVELLEDLIEALGRQGAGDIPVAIGGIIPRDDRDELVSLGAAAVFTPESGSTRDAMAELISILERG